MRSSRICDYKKFNEDFLNEDEKELEMINSITIDLMELEYELNKEVEQFIESGESPTEQEINQRLRKYYLLNNLNSVSTRVSNLYNQLYMLKGR